MSKNTYKENASADAKKTGCLETTGESSSAVTWSKHLFPGTESRNASTEVKGNPARDTENLDIPDSLTLARVDRENQGPWEAEYSYGGEADLHQHYDNCAKNPGHKDFIPVDKFSIEDLPEGYQHQDIVDYIRLLSDLTVRVAVNYVSDRRPATVPGSNQPYPGYGNRGQRRMTVGTGLVETVGISLDRQKTCECKDCRNSSTPETKYAVINIKTANHVVFDELEAEHTTCHLFFDSGGTPEACNDVVTLTGMNYISGSTDVDDCRIYHCTHDLYLVYTLLVACAQRIDLMDYIRERLPMIIQYKSSLDVADKQPLLFTVSHPHGCSKHISIGRWNSITCVNTEERDYTFEFTASTCPGSSGAHVAMPHALSIDISEEDFRYDPGTHSGKSQVQPGVNFFQGYYVENNSHNYLYKDPDDYVHWDDDFDDSSDEEPAPFRWSMKYTRCFPIVSEMYPFECPYGYIPFHRDKGKPSPTSKEVKKKEKVFGRITKEWPLHLALVP